VGPWRFCAVLVAAMLSLASARAEEANCTAWPLWQAFKRFYISDDGRVVDASTAEAITTSEGQAYALTFALVGNDPTTFARVLSWTRDNLTAGDPTHVLPAWRWGRAASGQWMVIDRNSASDADLWMAYALAEAGRLWHNTAYSEQARAMTALILRDEVALVPGLGATVLPGPRGFVSQETWRLNASYVPIQVLRALQRSGDSPMWTQLLESSSRVIIGSAPRGLAADWVLYRQAPGFVKDTATQGVGSYNAIRVYLWAGMLSEEDPEASRLMKEFAPMASAAARDATSESIDTETLDAQGKPPVGFLAALLPLLSHTKFTDTVQTYRQRIETVALRDNQHYYNDALTLFGLGWLDGRFHFDRHGHLRVRWSGSCHID
jgi:endoglucanase